MALAILAILLTNRREFQSTSDRASLRNALLALAVGWVGISPRRRRPRSRSSTTSTAITACTLSLTSVWLAVSERMVGIQTVALPPRANRFLAPTLLAIGLTVIALALFLLTRPVVDRRLRSGRAAELRARDIVRRHGSSTLDYFALRSDKRWFFHRDTLVAYAVHGGICLISPDPIGPLNERGQVWAAFRRYADRHGWVTAVMGASEEWLPIYRESGMRHVYLGDEAVVHVRDFSLSGGAMKGLRQAHHRVARKGYTASFHDPARLDRGTVAELARAHGAEPPGRARARLLDDARPHLRPPGHRPVAHRRARARRREPQPSANSSPHLASRASPSTSCVGTRPTIPTDCSTSPCARPSSTCGRTASTE